MAGRLRDEHNAGFAPKNSGPKQLPERVSRHACNIMNSTDAKRILETALICSAQPLALRDLASLFDDAVNSDSLRSMLAELQNDWRQRGVELVRVASGWRLQSRSEMRLYLDRLHPEKPPRYTRATMETLAVIAYRQPVTRGDMEDVRGVTINSLILRQLEDRGWIEIIGHREAPGRPALYATTRQFLEDLGIESLDQLPLIDGLIQLPDDMTREQGGPGSLLEPGLAIDGNEGGPVAGRAVVSESEQGLVPLDGTRT